MPGKWLVTVETSRLSAVVAELRARGCEAQTEAAVPMDDEREIVIPVSGPSDKERELTEVPGVKSVHPDSDVTLY